MNITNVFGGPDIDATPRSSAVWPGTRGLSPGYFALLLGVLIAALFPHVLSGTETFYFRDYGIFGYPLAKYHRDCFWNGEWPIWNSLNSCGIPYFAQWNTMVLYPLSLIYLLLPLPWSLALFCLGHLLLAGVAMYFLAYSWTKNGTAAALAGAAFAFNGLTLHCLMWPNNIAGLAWMPFVVLTAQHAAQRGGRAIIVAALIGTIQMLSGAPEIILFTWGFVLALLVGAVLWRELSPIALGRIALVVGLVIALAAVQLLPFLQLLAYSQRDAKFGTSSWSMPAWGWVNFVLPLFRESLSTSGVYFQIGQFWTSSYYAGIGVLLLALSAAWTGPRKAVAVLWAIAGLGLIMALGEKALVYLAIHKLFPFLGFIRFPVKFVLFPIFALPLLAAFGMARLETAGAVNASRYSRILAPISVLLALVLAGATLFSYWHPYHRLPWNDLWHNALLRVAFLGSLLVILKMLISRPQSRLPLQIALVLLLVLDVWTHAPNQNPTIPSELCVPGTQIPGHDPHKTRAWVSAQTHDLLYYAMVTNTAQDYVGRRAGLFGNLNLLDGVSTPDGFYSLYPLEQRQIWSKVFYTPATNFPAALADFVGIAHITTNLFEWQLRPSARPIVAAGAKPVFVDRREILNRLGAPFDPQETVYLPLEAKAGISVTNSSAARVSVADYRPGHIAADVEAPETALVTIAETYYAGWNASVDGKPAKIWHANHAFQALQVPAGRHHVELIYEEKTLCAGSIISASALLGCLLGWFKPKRQKPLAPEQREGETSDLHSHREEDLPANHAN